jgi:signal transduction histidine kinase
VRPVVAHVGDHAGPPPPRVRRAVRPLAAEESPAEVPWAVLLAALAALTLGLDLVLPGRLGAGALVVIPVLAANWTLGTRALVVVLAVVVAVEVAGAVLGRLDPLAAGGRLVAVALVTVVARPAASGVARGRRARERGVDVLLRSAHVLGRSFDQGRVAEEAVRSAAALAPVGTAVLLGVAGDTVTVLAAHGQAAGAVAPDLRLTRAGLPADALRVLDDGQPRVVPAAGLLSPDRVTAWALARVEVGGDVLGLLAVAPANRPDLPDDDLRLLAGIARVSGLAMGAAQRQTNLVDAEHRLQHSLVEAIESAEEVGSPEQIQDIVERARLLAVSALRADRGNISRLEGDELVVEHDHRPSLPYARRRPLSRSRQGAEAIRTRRPVHGRVASGSVGPDGIAWMVPAGIRWAISCPIIVGDEVVGLLGLGRSRDEPFTDADGEALMPIATLVGLLLRNARRLAEARQTDQVKSRFMHLAAHELRTPLAVIRGYLSLLEDGTYPVPDRTRAEAVETLVAKAQELESLVELLVMAARLEGGTLPHADGELNMVDEVAEALERVRPRARLEGARLTARALGLPHVATADRSHVALILDNLLNNALTYSPVPADVTVEVRGGDAIEVAVRDRGHGIPIDQQDRVFQRFHRADVGPARTAAGLGLGLTISQELAHLNGGELVLERSAPGEGSVFVLRLHRAQSLPADGPATSPAITDNRP